MIPENIELGRYRVEKKLGEGGMGEVYLAYDTSLDRRVALKVLSGEFSKDEQRAHRFRFEAKAASALNHPNIITIYEIGKIETTDFIATEYIEGETLRGKIARRELSLPETIRIAGQIADGLCAAHAAHIIHRDIKPENVMIRHDGYIKILDFGLAKPTAFAPTGTEDETMEMVKTAPGVVMGSVRYMSPEQARGKPVDERTDIWSLGIVLYEMATGKAPFDGETVSDTLANLIHLEPKPLFEILPDVPDEFQRIVRKSLQKNRDERYQTIKDFALDLKNLRREVELHQTEGQTRRLNVSSDSLLKQNSGENATKIYHTDDLPKAATHENLTQTQITAEQIAIRAQKSSNRVWRNAFAGIVSILLLGSLAFISAKLFGVNNVMPLPFQKTQISRFSDDGKSRLPAISPDGKYIAFQSGEPGARSVMVRQLATGSAVEIVPKSGFVFVSITFSPDGNYVYYVQGNSNIKSLYQVPTLGGTPKKIVEDIDSGITFAPDGKKIAFIRHTIEGTDTLFSANTEGTEVTPLFTTTQTEYGFFTYPAWSPDGKKIIMCVGTNLGGKTSEVKIAEFLPETGKFQVLPNAKWSYISDIYWKNDGTGFFALALEKDGEQNQVWSISYPEGERKRLTNDTNNYNWLGISGDNKTLITVKSESSLSIWKFTPSNKDLKQITPESRATSGDSELFSTANGDLLAARNKDAELNIWEITTDGKDVRQLTSGTNLNADPQTSPDGTKIVFMSNRSGAWRVWLMEADGKNAKQLTVVEADVNQFSPNFSGDGKSVIYMQQEKNSGFGKLMKVSIDGGTPEKVFPDGKNYEIAGYVSPDGKHLAVVHFNSDNKQFMQIFGLAGDQPLKPENEFEVGLMDEIKWSPDGKSLSYINREGIANIWQIALDGKLKKPLTNFTSGRIFSFTWSKDGRQIFMTRGTVNNELILIKDETK